jgi:transcriptional regulator with XRE-family HTH domain
LSAWAVLREARARAALSQRELAARAGKAQSEVARIEAGRQDPTFATLDRLVRAAGFDLRITLVPHNDHDERLIDVMLALSPDERLAALEAEADFLTSVTAVERASG